MAKYKVIVSKRVTTNLLTYFEFISNVSTEAARQFVADFELILDRLEENPLQFQVDTSFNNPYGYRRAIFSKWFKCIFVIEGYTVYLDSIVDCRQSSNDEI